MRIKMRINDRLPTSMEKQNMKLQDAEFGRIFNLIADLIYFETVQPSLNSFSEDEQLERGTQYKWLLPATLRERMDEARQLRAEGFQLYPEKTYRGMRGLRETHPRNDPRYELLRSQYCQPWLEKSSPWHLVFVHPEVVTEQKEI